MQDERPVIFHQGTYKKTATLGEAVFMITGMTIGAGILGLPYAVAQVGLIIGLSYIIILGFIMLSLNLMIGEVAVRTRSSMQLPGFAGKYLGPWAKGVLSITTIFSSIGVLLAYIIGEGSALSALFGGSSLWWSVIFWAVGSFLIWGGLQRIKSVEKIISLLVIIIIIILSLFILPHFNPVNFQHVNFSKLFFPFGVILFALHATPAIGEAFAVTASPVRFRRALIMGTLIPIALYALFALAVVGFSGLATTEVATIGIGQKFGPFIGVLANIFAVFAMSTGFMGLGTALKETLAWDHHVPELLAKFLVITIPLLLFLLGLRSFIAILDVVGGLFIAIEGIIMVGVYLSARRHGALPANADSFSHPWIVALPVLLFFSILTVISFYALLLK